MYAMRGWSTVLAALMLAACGSADKPPPPVEQTVFRDVVVTPQEEAQNVQNVVDEHKRALDEAIRRNENDE